MYFSKVHSTTHFSYTSALTHLSSLAAAHMGAVTELGGSLCQVRKKKFQSKKSEFRVSALSKPDRNILEAISDKNFTGKMIFEMIFILVDISWEIFGSSTREDPRPRQPTPVQRLPPLQGCDVCLTLSTKMKIISKLSFPVKILSEIASRMFLSGLESAEPPEQAGISRN